MSTPSRLRAHARERGVDLTRQAAYAMLRRLGPEGARERVDAIGALIDLASAWGRRLTTQAAARRLAAAGGDWELARDRFLEQLRRRRQRRFDAAWTRAERDWRAREARARHAAILVQLDRGSLGHRAGLALLAAADAGLTRPDAAGIRAQLWRICDLEVARRHPSRPPLDEAPPADPVARVEWERERQRHSEHMAPTLAEEARVLELLHARLRGPDDDDDTAAGARRDLALTINALADHPAFRADVERVLQRVRHRLLEALERGGDGAWRPDPEAFRVAVIERAAAEAAHAA